MVFGVLSGWLAASGDYAANIWAVLALAAYFAAVPRGYDELLPHTEEFPHGDLRLRLLDLPTLIAVKTAAGRPKDRMTVPILIATLEERRKPR